ncbi:MAG: hypothetical protein JF597_04205 [Streptomyces sp.]|uniref:hypothetical protein n=1 Tax=Streptomyces sp. TaxID=1931 RepID=UPI0025F2F4E7|nr:hypothetical protein [Streptomyces sp.]MBW8792805.1 hypothetical protein [Streptomyces sp.]
MRRNALRLAGNVCLLAAALGLTVPATAGTATAGPARTARAAALPQVRSVSLPIKGVFRGPSENIAVTGTLDVSVITLPDAAGGGTAQIISSLDDTSGTGDPSGTAYDLVGAHRDTLPFSAAATTTLKVRPAFLLVSRAVPPNPVVPPNPIRPVTVSVTLGSTGAIGAVTATVGNPDT